MISLLFGLRNGALLCEGSQIFKKSPSFFFIVFFYDLLCATISLSPSFSPSLSLSLYMCIYLLFFQYHVISSPACMHLCIVIAFPHYVPPPVHCGPHVKEYTWIWQSFSVRLIDRHLGAVFSRYIHVQSSLPSTFSCTPLQRDRCGGKIGIAYVNTFFHGYNWPMFFFCFFIFGKNRCFQIRVYA